MKRNTFITRTIYSTVIVLTAVFYSSCNNHEQELANANRERDSLQAIVVERDSSVSDFLQSYNEIQQNLDSVALRGATISKSINNQTEQKGDARQRIRENIDVINNLMMENRQKISELNRRLANSGNKNVQLKKLITALNEQLVIKDCEMEVLNERIVKLNDNLTLLQTSMDTMMAQNTAQTTQLTSQLHTAYYVIGKSSELKKKNVIDKEGGLLGIGKTSTLNSNFDMNNFTQIDYTTLNTIPIGSKEAKIITTHPGGTYTMDKDGDKMLTLRITDPEKFWSVSKYLVIVKD